MWLWPTRGTVRCGSRKTQLQGRQGRGRRRGAKQKAGGGVDDDALLNVAQTGTNEAKRSVVQGVGEALTA